MKMSKSKFILGQLAKSCYKKYENYVVTRIWHLLNNENIKMITQQHISINDKRALTDLYFPQIKLHVEVDEPPHFHANGNQRHSDLVRQSDIVNATGHKILRVDASGEDLKVINDRVDHLVSEISRLWCEKGKPNWDFDNEFSPYKYIQKGYVSALDDDVFRTIADACNAFGNNFKGYQRASCKHAKEENRFLWFPKLFNFKGWSNELTEDEEYIYEVRDNNSLDYFNQVMKGSETTERLTFAFSRDNLGFVMYRFKGVFKLDIQKSEEIRKVTYKRISTTAKTYKN